MIITKIHDPGSSDNDEDPVTVEVTTVISIEIIDAIVFLLRCSHQFAYAL